MVVNGTDHYSTAQHSRYGTSGSERKQVGMTCFENVIKLWCLDTRQMSTVTTGARFLKELIYTSDFYVRDVTRLLSRAEIC